MSPACLSPAVLAVRPHNGQTQADVSYPDATIARTFPFVPHICKEASGFTFVLETHDDVIGVAHNDDLTPGMVLTPPVCPEIEDVMEVDIGQQWRGNRPLGRAYLRGHKLSFFHHPLPLATCGQGGLYDGHRCGVRQSASATRD
jgi:hypothetical protein